GSEPRRNPGLSPPLDNGLALPEIFTTLRLAHDRIQASPRRRLKEKRARSSCGGFIKTQWPVDGGADKRRKFEQAGYCISRGHEIGRQPGIERFPVGCQ